MAEKRNESTTRRGTGTEANASERIYRETVDVRRRAGDAKYGTRGGRGAHKGEGQMQVQA